MVMKSLSRERAHRDGWRNDFLRRLKCGSLQLRGTRYAGAADRRASTGSSRDARRAPGSVVTIALVARQPVMTHTRPSLARLLLVSLVLLVCACRDRHDDHAPPPPSTTAPATAPPPTVARAPLGGAWLQPIDGDLGVVAVPVGATDRRPWVLSLHGAESAAEWGCGDWMAPTEGHPFVVCPRTRTERAGRLASWGSVEEASSRSREALARVRERFGEWLTDADPVIVGFSQGAEMAVVTADTRALPWSAVFVHEGGYRQAKTSLAHLLAGPESVYATCSTWNCGASLPRKTGPRARTVDYGHHGHAVGPVYLRVRADFADMVEHREEWAGLPELKRRRGT